MAKKRVLKEFRNIMMNYIFFGLDVAIFSGLMQPCAKVIRQLEFCRRMRAWRISSRQWAAGCGQYSGVYSVRKDSLISLSLNLPAWQTLFQSTVAAAERVFAFLEEEEERESGVLSVEEDKGDVRFDRVKFGYSPDKIIIKDFSSVVESGQRVAIVGPTGAGKDDSCQVAYAIL